MCLVFDFCVFWVIQKENTQILYTQMKILKKVLRAIENHAWGTCPYPMEGRLVDRDTHIFPLFLGVNVQCDCKKYGLQLTFVECVLIARFTSFLPKPLLTCLLFVILKCSYHVRL